MGLTISEFYCTRCGQRSMPLPRTGKQREPGHLKKLYCVHCEDTVNHVEIRPFGKYKVEDFLIEYVYHNFDENGNRIEPSYRKFESMILQIKKGEEKK